MFSPSLTSYLLSHAWSAREPFSYSSEPSGRLLVRRWLWESDCPESSWRRWRWWHTASTRRGLDQEGQPPSSIAIWALILTIIQSLCRQLEQQRLTACYSRVGHLWCMGYTWCTHCQWLAKPDIGDDDMVDSYSKTNGEAEDETPLLLFSQSPKYGVLMRPIWQLDSGWSPSHHHRLTQFPSIGSLKQLNQPRASCTGIFLLHTASSAYSHFTRLCPHLDWGNNQYWLKR